MDILLAQNTDILHNILTFLDNDGTSVVRFALSSKVMYDRIMRQESVDPKLWKNLIANRWKRSRRRPAVSGTIAEEGRSMTISYRELYIEKRRADAQAVQRLQEMTSILQNVLQLSETHPMVDSESPHVGQAWEHQGWNFLLRNRADCFDVLKSIARRHIVKSSSSICDRLMGFLAARCVQDFYLADCLLEWRQLVENSGEDERPQGQASQQRAAYQLEEYVLLLCEIQKTPYELLLEDTFYSKKNPEELDFDLNQESANITRAEQSLDEIAGVCKDRIDEELGTSANVTSKLKIVNDVLINRYGFSGNVADYYNYRNVLMNHVLESKTGMPLTLCVIYCCVCRRLGIPVQVTGLPGHIVLGYDIDDELTSPTERRSFIDVFHGCRFLSRDDCRRIVATYGIRWREEFLDPLPTKMTIQRIFNNLRNCHEKALGQREPPLFCTDLLFQQHTLGMVHRYPPEIACTLLERLAQDLSIVLSPDLLRAYKLLSPRGLGSDPVVNATHARTLLELSSYVGLSYHNYA